MLIALLSGVSLRAAQANAQPSGPRFQVASIRPSAETRGTLYHLPGDGFRVQGLTLPDLISYAWDTPATEITRSPKWASSERFDTEATPEDPPGGPSKELESPCKKEMVRNLPQKRFKLEMRAEERDTPVYALVAGRGGPKLEGNSGKPYRMGGRNGSLIFQKVSVAAFAKFLSGNLRGEIGRLVVDKTGISDEFDFNLTWAPLKQNAESDLPSVFTACEQQLGLRLQPDRSTVRFWVVISAERPSPN